MYHQQQTPLNQKMHRGKIHSTPPSLPPRAPSEISSSRNEKQAYNIVGTVHEL